MLVADTTLTGTAVAQPEGESSHLRAQEYDLCYQHSLYRQATLEECVVSARRRRIGTSLPTLRDLAVPLVMILVMFVMGIVFGSVGAQTLDPTQKGQLVDYLGKFSMSLADSVQGSRVSPQDAILTNLQKLAIVWLLAVTVIGAPAILVVVFLQGFASGFTVAILIEEWSAKGLLLAAASVVPHNAFLVSGLVLAGTAGLAYAWVSVRGTLSRDAPPFGQRITALSVICAGCSLLLIVAGVVEAYVSPYLVQRVAPLVF